jgi:hypothetical protein
VLPGFTGLGENETVVPAGLPLAVRVMGVENPLLEIVPNVIAEEAGPGQLRITPEGLSKSKLGAGGTIVKSASEISKKIFPMASIFILAFVVRFAGTVRTSDPSFGVLAANTIGKVFPPSVDKDILTSKVLIGDDEVPATFHRTVCEVPVVQISPPLGEVTTKGPVPAIVLI